jgi:hypothetical protein
MANNPSFDWLKIKTEYLATPTTSLELLAQKHGINPSYLRYVASREKWVKQRQVKHKTTESKEY